MFLTLPTDIFIGIFNFLESKDISKLDISVNNKKLRTNLLEIYNYISMEGNIFNKNFMMFIKKREISINQLYIKNPNMSTLVLYMNNFSRYYKYISFKKIRNLTIELNNPKGLRKIICLFGEVFPKIKYLKIIIHKTYNINHLCIWLKYYYENLKKLEIINLSEEYINLPRLYYSEKTEYFISKKLNKLILSGFIIKNVGDIDVYNLLVKSLNLTIIKLKITFSLKTINLLPISEHLESLILHDCYINFLDTDFPDVEFPNLKYLDIRHNLIYKIPSLILKTPNLELLRVGDRVNQISKEPIKGLIFYEEYFSASKGLKLFYRSKKGFLKIETESDKCRVTFNNFDFICI